jgi:ubiquinone/menaquinone biosynthesis C-methylase UbiE
MFLNTTANASNLKDTYALPVGQMDAIRLDLQSVIIHKESVEHLKSAGLKEGQVVYDVACGNGYMTLHMAQTVGPKGHVFAVDRSQAQLDLAKKRIHDAGLDNVTFIQAEVLDDQIPCPQPADVVYARLLLMHLQAPEVAVQNMAKLLKPDGVLALNEPHNSTITLVNGPEFDDYKRAFLGLGQHYKVDYDMGVRLKELARNQGFDDVTESTHQHTLEPEVAQQILTMTFKSIGNKALEHQLITQAQYEEIEKMSANNNKALQFSVQYYITARKTAEK